MFILILYLTLLVLYIVASIFVLSANFSWALLILQIAGFVAIGRLFTQELAKRWLPLYFVIERTKLFFVSDTTSKWSFNARFDGINSRDIFDTLETKLRENRFKIKTISKNNREKEIIVDDTLFVTMSYTAADDSPYGVNHIDVISRTIEVSYGHAKKKLENQIEPFLILLSKEIKPEKHSFELNVEFINKSNPFFNVYIANLSPSQVEDFKVVLHVDGNSPKTTHDKVVISSKKLCITSDSTNSFRKLAENFILLTPDTKLLIGDKNG